MKFFGIELDTSNFIEIVLETVKFGSEDIFSLVKGMIFAKEMTDKDGDGTGRFVPSWMHSLVPRSDAATDPVFTADNLVDLNGRLRDLDKPKIKDLKSLLPILAKKFSGLNYGGIKVDKITTWGLLIPQTNFDAEMQDFERQQEEKTERKMEASQEKAAKKKEEKVIMCRNDCGTRIKFIPGDMSASGKPIPSDYETGKHHDCPNNPYNGGKEKKQPKQKLDDKVQSELGGSSKSKQKAPRVKPNDERDGAIKKVIKENLNERLDLDSIIHRVKESVKDATDKEIELNVGSLQASGAILFKNGSYEPKTKKE